MAATHLYGRKPAVGNLTAAHVDRPDEAADALLEITAAERPDIHPIIAMRLG
jgi:hypothetical protein